MEREKSFLGTGMKFPPEIDRNTGRFKLSSGEIKIKEAIYLILKTYKGERRVLPDFGSNLNNYVFAKTDTTTLSLMAKSIQKSLFKNEKRINNIKVNILVDKTESSCLNINISYIIVEDNKTGNIVFPFYIQDEKDVKEITQHKSD